MLLNTFTLINHFTPTEIPARCPFRGRLGPLGSRGAASRWVRTWETLVPRLGTRSRHRKRSHAGTPAPTTGEVKFFKKTKVSPGSEFSLHFMKMALPSRLRAVPSELAASAEALLGSLYPAFRPPRASPPAPRRGSRTSPRQAAEQPPSPRADAAAPRPLASQGISPPRLRDIHQRAEGRPSRPSGISVSYAKGYPSAQLELGGSPL